VLRDLIARHVSETASPLAATLLNDWAEERGHFWQVVPRDYVRYLPAPIAEVALAAAE